MHFNKFQVLISLIRLILAVFIYFILLQFVKNIFLNLPIFQLFLEKNTIFIGYYLGLFALPLSIFLISRIFKLLFIDHFPQMENLEKQN